MTTTTQKLVTTNTLLTTLITSALLACLPAMSHAEGWELRSAPEMVPGTREIESGKIDVAIGKSEVHLPHVAQQKKVAVLTNLCIAYILKNDFDRADDYCDEAVERPNEKAVSYNNRGVLNALRGDLEAAMQDFDKAAKSGCFGKCTVAESAPRDLPRPVARRNLGKAKYLARQAQMDSEEKVAAQFN